MARDGAVLIAQGVSRRYGEGDAAVDALRDVDVSMERGRLTGVMGPSGSGKSTLMHILAGLDRPTAGTVELDGTDITKLDDDRLTKLRRDHIGFVFQFFNLLPMLDARENMELPLAIAGERPDSEWFDQVVEQTRLGDRLTHRPSELSGGQQQRVAIARAIVADPTLLVCDEPTGDLDRESAEEVLSLLQLLNREQVHQCRFARARRPHDRDQLARLHLERHAAQCVDRRLTFAVAAMRGPGRCVQL